MSGSDAVLRVSIQAALGTFSQDLGKAAASAEANAKKIQSAIGNAEAQVVSFSKKIVGLIGVPLGASAIIGTFKALEDAAVASERSVNQLNAVLAATGYSAGLTRTQLDAVGSSVKDSSIFSAGDIRAAETALLRFRDVQGDTFKQALSLAPDVATVLGVTLPEAAVLLGKALGGDGASGMRTLKAAGVSLSEQQIDLASRFAEAGDKASAMKIILDAVTRSVGGAARADAQGLSGDVNNLSRAWSGLEKTFAKEIFGNQSKSAQYLTTSFQGLSFAIEHAGESYEKLTELMTFSGLFKFVAGAMFDVHFKKPSAPGSDDQDKLAKEESAKYIEGVKTRAGTAQQLQDQQDEKAYVREQASLKKEAEAAATFYSAQLGAQRAYLDQQAQADEFAYSRGALTIDEFYDRQKASISANELATVEANEAEIRSQRPLATALGSNTEARAAAEAKIATLQTQSEQSRNAFDARQQQSARNKILDVERLGDEYGALEEKVQSALGNTGAAAGIATERANRDLRRRLETTVDTGTPTESADAQRRLDDMDMLARSTVLQGDLTDATRKYADVVAGLGIANAHVDALSQAGLLSEIDLLNKKAEIAKQYIPLLQAEIDAQQKIADGLPRGVLKTETLQKIAQEKLQIEQLGLAADGLKNKFDSTITDNFTTALDAIVGRTKSVKQAFGDMGKSIEQTITHMVDEQLAKQLYQALFGATGATGGVSPGGLLAGLFGASGAAAGPAAAAAAAATAGGGSAAPGVGLLAGLGAGAAGIAAWAKGLFGGSATIAPTADALAMGPPSLFDSIDMWGGEFGGVGGFFANGTNYAPGGLAMVGEKGPEIVNLPRGSQVIPNSMLKSGGGKSSSTTHTVNNTPVTVNVPAGTSRASATQIALATARELAIRTRRFS